MTRADNRAYDWRMTFVAWVVITIVFVIRTLFMTRNAPILQGNDDAMRLDVVHDFMAGQNWFDHIQHRINAPYGAEIHWSRLIDFPLSLLIRFFGLFSPAHADLAAVSVWPIILLLGLLILSSRLAVRLAGPDAQLPGLVLPALSILIMAEFPPGRIDHHSVQILLTLALVLSTLGALERPSAAIWAGLAAATSLAIGTESLAFIAAAVIAFGVMWSLEADRIGTMVRFGLSFAVFTLVQFLIAVPPQAWLEVHLDAISIVFVISAIGVALVFVLLSRRPLSSAHPVTRLGVGAGLGAVLLAGLVALFPQVLQGPYAGLDPWLTTYWLDNISEAKPLWRSLADAPAYTLGFFVPAVLALIATLWRLLKGPRDGREAWGLYALFLVFAVISMLFEVRGARLLSALTVPAGAYVILGARKLYLDRKSLVFAIPLVFAWIGFTGIVITVVVMLIQLQGPKLKMQQSVVASRAECLVPKAFDPLKTLPPQIVMSPLDLGAPMLLYTKLSVVGAPYHRGQEGILDTYHYFNDPPAEAKKILEKRGVSLIVVCEAMPEMRGLPIADPNSVVRQLDSGKVPSYLTEITPKGSILRIFKPNL